MNSSANRLHENSSSSIRNDCILVNPNQKGNKILKFIKNSSLHFTKDIAPAHYAMGQTSCALFLSMKYHVIYPNYIYDLLTSLGNSYQLRIVIVLMDHIEYIASLKELTKLSIRANCTLMLSWTPEEAASYLDNYKCFLDKSPDIILGKQSAAVSDSEKIYDCLIEALSTVRSVNKTDAASLLRVFDSFEKLVKTDASEIAICPGMGLQKAERLNQLLYRPFKRSD